MADMLRERLERLHGHRAKSPLETRTGQALFARRAQLQIAFFETLVRDAEIARLPRLEDPAPSMR